MRMEKELYGEPDDPSKQHSGINFEKYDDIPVEANGAGVPEPVVAFTNPPLSILCFWRTSVMLTIQLPLLFKSIRFLSLQRAGTLWHAHR